MSPNSKLYSQYCGIDVGSTSLDYCFNVANKIIEEGRINNILKDIKKLFTKRRFDNTLFVLEFTGSYSSKLIAQLNALNRPMIVLNPQKSSNFMKFQGVSNKTDKQAAQTLAAMGPLVEKDNLYELPSQEIQERKQLLSSLSGLKKQKRQLENQIHAKEQEAEVVPLAISTLKTVLKAVDKEIAKIEKELVKPMKDEAFNENMKLAQSISGVGIKTAQTLLIVANNLANFDDSDKLAKYLGITPSSHYSGNSVRKKGKITKVGSSQVRACLFMGSLSAIRYNEACKQLYKRLRAKGKPYRVAMVAVMRKLVRQIFACVKNKTPFDKNYHSTVKETTK